MDFFSERLLFREFSKSDFGLFYSVFSNGQVMKYAWMDQANHEEDVAPWFEKVLQNNATPAEHRSNYEFAVYLASNDRFIGFSDIEIHIRNRSGGSGEIGYFLMPAFWGSGYATEIARTLIDYCFTELNLHRVTAQCNSNNLPSEQVMKKAGMTWEGEYRRARYKDGHWDDEKHYGILKEEWEKQKGCKA